MSSDMKITTRSKLATVVADLKRTGKIIGFTSGTFDLLHAGHVEFLEKAKENCDILIAGVNTDETVRSYKGKGRPLVPLKYRMRVLAALSSVDYVFSFSERRNRKNIEVLKPALYVKAGDYTKNEMTSSDVVVKHGGKALIIPMRHGLSTTNIINKITRQKNMTVIQADQSIRANLEKREPQKAILIDRDGTINEEVAYLHEPEKFKLTVNAGEGLNKFQELGYKIVIITLQAGIGLGYFTKEDFYKVNQEMFKQLAPHDVIIDKIYFATQGKTPDGVSAKLSLIERARDELDLDLSKSVFIGDKTGDLLGGDSFGSIKIGMKTGYGINDRQYDVKPNYTASDLLDAANWLEQLVYDKAPA